MIIEEANPFGGRKPTKYPLTEDPKTGKLGFKIGYLKTGEPVLLRSADMDRILRRFWNTRNSVSTRLIEWWITK